MSQARTPEIRLVEVDRLVPFEGNPRKCGKDQLERLARSIEGFGFVEPIIAWDAPELGDDGQLLVIVGHQRLEAARQCGKKKVPVIIYPFSDRREALEYNVASNRLAEMSSWDWKKLGELIEYLDIGDGVDLELTGWTNEELEDIVTGGFKPKESTESSEESREIECPKCGYRWQS